MASKLLPIVAAVGSTMVLVWQLLPAWVTVSTLAAAIGLGVVAIMLAARQCGRSVARRDPKTPPPRPHILKEGFSARKVAIREGQRPWDAIVIGSGIGGLSCAAILSRVGKRVLVLEQHDVIGGCTHTFEAKGFEFDTGLHYVGGDMDKPTSQMRRLFDTITDCGVKWAPCDADFDIISFGKHPEKFRAMLCAEFPSEVKAINEYIELVKAVDDKSALWFLAKLLPRYTGAPSLVPHLAAEFDRLMKTTTSQYFKSLTSNQELIEVLTYGWGNYGTAPDDSSMGYHLLLTAHYLHGGFYPVGGPAELGKHIVQQIERSGGLCLVRAAVERLVIESGRAVGVEVKGTEIRAPFVISCAGAFNTFGKLLPEVQRFRVHRELQCMGYSKQHPVRPGRTHATLFVGLCDPKHGSPLQLPSSNMWTHPSFLGHCGDDLSTWYDASSGDSHKEPDVFIAFPSAKDPTWQQRFPGRHTCEVVANVPYDFVAKWRHKRVRHRGADYEELKAFISKKLMLAAEGVVAFTELGTPLSNETYLGSEHGASYGLDHNVERFQQDWLRPQTAIPGLYLTGTEIMGCGVATAAYAGLWSAMAVDRRCTWEHLHLIGGD